MNEADLLAFITVFSLIGLLAIVLMVSRAYTRRLRSQEILKALEMGQELPDVKRPARPFLADLRTGVLLVCFSIGFFLFLAIVGDDGMTAMALIPLFLGLGFAINAILIKRLGGEQAATGAASAPVTYAERASDDDRPDAS